MRRIVSVDAERDPPSERERERERDGRRDGPPAVARLGREWEIKKSNVVGPGPLPQQRG